MSTQCNDQEHKNNGHKDRKEEEIKKRQENNLFLFTLKLPL
jgi:hypothetical protein